MKFLADIGISPKTVSFLKRLGHEAVHLHEQGLDRLSDSKILEKAVVEGSIILTHDLDYGHLLAFSGEPSPSVIIFRLRNTHPDNLFERINNTWSNIEDPLNTGAIVALEDAAFRIRPLPITMHAE